MRFVSLELSERPDKKYVIKFKEPNKNYTDVFGILILINKFEAQGVSLGCPCFMYFLRFNFIDRYRYG